MWNLWTNKGLSLGQADCRLTNKKHDPISGAKKGKRLSDGRREGDGCIVYPSPPPPAGAAYPCPSVGGVMSSPPRDQTSQYNHCNYRSAGDQGHAHQYPRNHRPHVNISNRVVTDDHIPRRELSEPNHRNPGNQSDLPKAAVNKRSLPPNGGNNVQSNKGTSNGARHFIQPSNHLGSHSISLSGSGTHLGGSTKDLSGSRSGLNGSGSISHGSGLNGQRSSGYGSGSSSHKSDFNESRPGEYLSRAGCHTSISNGDVSVANGHPIIRGQLGGLHPSMQQKVNNGHAALPPVRGTPMKVPSTPRSNCDNPYNTSQQPHTKQHQTYVPSNYHTPTPQRKVSLNHETRVQCSPGQHQVAAHNMQETSKIKHLAKKEGRAKTYLTEQELLDRTEYISSYNNADKHRSNPSSRGNHSEKPKLDRSRSYLSDHNVHVQSQETARSRESSRSQTGSMLLESSKLEEGVRAHLSSHDLSTPGTNRPHGHMYDQNHDLDFYDLDKARVPDEGQLTDLDCHMLGLQEIMDRLEQRDHGSNHGNTSRTPAIPNMPDRKHTGHLTDHVQGRSAIRVPCTDNQNLRCFQVEYLQEQEETDSLSIHGIPYPGTRRDSNGMHYPGTNCDNVNLQHPEIHRDKTNIPCPPTRGTVQTSSPRDLHPGHTQCDPIIIPDLPPWYSPGLAANQQPEQPSQRKPQMSSQPVTSPSHVIPPPPGYRDNSIKPCHMSPTIPRGWTSEHQQKHVSGSVPVGQPIPMVPSTGAQVVLGGQTTSSGPQTIAIQAMPAHSR